MTTFFCCTVGASAVGCICFAISVIWNNTLSVVCALLIFGVCVYWQTSAGVLQVRILNDPVLWGTWVKTSEASSRYSYASWREKLWKGWNWPSCSKECQRDLFRESPSIIKCEGSKIGKLCLRLPYSLGSFFRWTLHGFLCFFILPRFSSKKRRLLRLLPVWLRHVCGEAFTTIYFTPMILTLVALLLTGESRNL